MENKIKYFTRRVGHIAWTRITFAMYCDLLRQSGAPALVNYFQFNGIEIKCEATPGD